MFGQHAVNSRMLRPTACLREAPFREAPHALCRVLALGRAWTLLACTVRRHRWEREEPEARKTFVGTARIPSVQLFALAKHPARAHTECDGVHPGMMAGALFFPGGNRTVSQNAVSARFSLGRSLFLVSIRCLILKQLLQLFKIRLGFLLH